MYRKVIDIWRKFMLKHRWGKYRQTVYHPNEPVSALPRFSKPHYFEAELILFWISLIILDCEKRDLQMIFVKLREVTSTLFITRNSHVLIYILIMRRGIENEMRDILDLLLQGKMTKKINKFVSVLHSYSPILMLYKKLPRIKLVIAFLKLKFCK